MVSVRYGSPRGCLGTRRQTIPSREMVDRSRWPQANVSRPVASFPRRTQSLFGPEPGYSRSSSYHLVAPKTLQTHSHALAECYVPGVLDIANERRHENIRWKASRLAYHKWHNSAQLAALIVTLFIGYSVVHRLAVAHVAEQHDNYILI